MNNFSLREISIYPNPANDWLMVTGSSYMEQIRLVNAAGQVVIDAHVSGNEHTINTSGLFRGNYILQVVFSDGGFYSASVVAGMK